MTPLRRRIPWKRICYNGGIKRRLLSNYSTASSFLYSSSVSSHKGFFAPPRGIDLSMFLVAAGLRMTGVGVIASLIFRRY